MSKHKEIIRILVITAIFAAFGSFIGSFAVHAADYAVIEVSSFSVDGDKLVPGEEGTIRLVLHNISATYNAENVVITITGNWDVIAPSYGTDNQYFVGHIGKGESKEVEIPVKVANNAGKPSEEIKCDISFQTIYRNNVGITEEISMTNSVMIIVPVAVVSHAYVEISDYSIEGDVLVPGKDTVIFVDVSNTSATTQVDSVVVTLSSTSQKIFPAYKTDNQYYIGSLKSNETKTLKIPVSVSNTFDEGGAELTFDIFYISGNTNESNKVSIVLPALGGTPVTVKSLEVGSSAIVNSKSLLSLTLWNNSLENITDARIIITGNVSEDSKEIQLETLNSMKNYYEDCQITFTTLGSQEIEIKLTYTDVNGQVIETNLGSYNVTVNEQASNVDPDNTNKSIQLLGRGLAIAGLLAACVAAFVYIKKR